MKAALQNYLPSIELILKDDVVTLCIFMKLYYYKNKKRVVEDIYKEFSLNDSRKYVKEFSEELEDTFMNKEELDIHFGNHPNRDMLHSFDVIVDEIKDVSLMYKKILYTDLKVQRICELDSFNKEILALVNTDENIFIRVKFDKRTNDEGFDLVYKIKDKMEKDALIYFDNYMEEYKNNFESVKMDGYIAKQLTYVECDEVEVYL